MADTMKPQSFDASRPRPLAEIDTVWFDMSALMLLPVGYMSGIPRTIRKILEAWSVAPWTRIKFSVFVQERGVAELCPEALYWHLYQTERAAGSAGVAAEAESPEDARPYSRYWYIPWAMRHQYRSVEKAVRGGITKFCVDPNPPQGHRSAERPHFPPYAEGSLLGPVELGPRDLVFSLGGLWVPPECGKTISAARQRGRFHFVSLIYDLIPLITPQYMPDRPWVDSYLPATGTQLRESSVMLTISEHSKRDILNYAREQFLPVGPVEVFTLGSDITPPDQDAPHHPSAQQSRPYVLTVGTIESRKNHYGMYQAWRKLVKTIGPDKVPDLVFAGKPGPHSDDLLYMVRRDPLIKNKIIVKSFVDDRELDWLYKNCLFTLYPSLYEGWGLPVEESFIYGKVCITTNVSSLPEVGGEFAEYVEAEDVDGIVQAVIKCLDPAYRASREQLIRERFKPNTWEQAGTQLQTILQKYFSFPADRARRREAARPASRSKLARAMSFFW